VNPGQLDITLIIVRLPIYAAPALRSRAQHRLRAARCR